MKPSASWPLTHSSLLMRIQQAEDVVAWNEFVHVYGPLIYQFGRKRGLQDADAQDVTQIVFSVVNRALGTFEYDRTKGRFCSWLGTVIRNEMVRYLKKKQRPGLGVGGDDSNRSLEEAFSITEAEWNDSFISHIYDKAMAKVRQEFLADTWRAFELVWIEETPAQDVATQLGRTPNWVYKAKFNVLQRLKEEVQFLASDTSIFK